MLLLLFFFSSFLYHLPQQDIFATLRYFVSQFSTDDASSVVVLMSHGGDGYINGNDGMRIELKEILELFKPHQCPNLRNKPKMFFVQACRGGRKGGEYFING